MTDIDSTAGKTGDAAMRPMSLLYMQVPLKQSS